MEETVSEFRRRPKRRPLPEPLKVASFLLTALVAVGGFASFLLGRNDARAEKAEKTAAQGVAEAKADVAALRKDMAGELGETREDIRGLYRFLLTHERQPRLEAREGPP